MIPSRKLIDFKLDKSQKSYIGSGPRNIEQKQDDITQEQIKETNLTSEEIDVAHPKRHDAPDDNTEQCKQFRAAIDKFIHGFICAITQKLPIDPVIAEDGNVYERMAIEQWLKHRTTSPATNNIIGKNLLPTVQIKNLLHSRITNSTKISCKANALTKECSTCHPSQSVTPPLCISYL